MGDSHCTFLNINRRSKTKQVMTENDVNEFLSNLAKNVRKHRVEQGMTQEELGFKSGTSQTTIKNIESKQTNPTAAILYKVVRGLGLKFSELLGE